MIPAPRANSVAGGDALVELSGIGKDYPAMVTRGGRLRTVLELVMGKEIHDRYQALDDISFVIRRGESWGIIGENGAGKSTLLKIIAGVAQESRGRKIVNGRVSALLELGTGFHPEYSGRENLFLAAALMGWSRAELTARLDAILAFADIGTHIEQPVKTYSSGMVVRLGFALATTLEPDLLVTDEVLAVGDESFQKKCLRWMENYRAQGGALLLCSHSMYHIQSLCEKAVWIHHGRARMQGEVFAVTQAYLAYHEEKNRRDEPGRPSHETRALYACMESLQAEDARGRPGAEFVTGADIVVNGVYTSPDDSPTVVMVGVTRLDGTPVFGTSSNDAGFTSNRVAAGRFAFRFVVKNNPLLPGKYRFRGHTLDEHGLRLFDSLEIEVIITGKTRDHGLVRLDHEWQAGNIPADSLHGDEK